MQERSKAASLRALRLRSRKKAISEGKAHAHFKTGKQIIQQVYDCWAKQARMSKAARSRQAATSQRVALVVVRRLLRQIYLIFPHSG